MSIVERIITVYNDKGSKQAVKDLKKLEKDFINAGKKIGKAFGVATLAVGAFAAKVGVDAVKAATEDQKSQVLLANSLRNTVGATDDAIKAVEDYITQQQKLFSVADDQLRPSLAALAAATGSITEAQKLQSVALDVAANKQIDLVTASKLLAKAHGGNIGALKKLFPEISANTVKSKDFATALDLVAKASSGAAAAAADTLAGRLEGLKLAYGEILETLGYALLPVIIEFASYIQANVLPALEAWTNANKTKIATSLKNIFDVLQTVIVKLGQFFDFITRNIETLKIFGAILAGIFVGGKIYAGISALVAAIGLVTGALTAQTTAASTAAVATGFATAGVSLALGAASAILFYNAMKKVTGEVQASTTALGENSAALSHLAELQGKYQVKTIKNTKVLTKEEIAAAKAAKVAAAAAAIIAKQKEASLKAIAALTKLGAKPTSETDPIQLEAARLNLLKQNNLQEQRRLEAIIENMNAQMKANEAVQRYVDLLGVVADQNISNEEVILLSRKWNISQDAVVAYTTAIFAVNDAKLSTEEIDLLAKQWGITKLQAEMYLDFFKYVNDGKLDQSEINALMDKWGLTNKEVKDYADKIAKGVDPSDLWPTPGNQAAKSWKDALAALNAYLAATGTKISPTAPTPGGGGGVVSPNKASIEAMTAAEAEKLLSAMPSSVPTTLTPGEISGMRYAAQAAAQAAAQQKMLDSIALTDPIAQSSLQSGLAGGASLSAALSGSRYAAQAAAQYGSGTTVNVTVQGSVTTQNDLVASIRDGLLQGQNNGQAIVKSATTI